MTKPTATESTAMSHSTTTHSAAMSAAAMSAAAMSAAATGRHDRRRTDGNNGHRGQCDHHPTHHGTPPFAATTTAASTKTAPPVISKDAPSTRVGEFLFRTFAITQSEHIAFAIGARRAILKLLMRQFLTNKLVSGFFVDARMRR
jgi:hypothetical protein